MVSVDSLVDGVHFPPQASPEDIGYKGLAVNLSDLAAMGAEPLRAIVNLSLPRDDPTFSAAFHAGIQALASTLGVAVFANQPVYGHLTVTIQVYGCTGEGESILRSGARPGDAIFVTGTLGDAGLGLAVCQGAHVSRDQHRAFFLGRLHRPKPRVAEGIAMRGLASAAIDISDGLVGDLSHILSRSGVGARIEVAKLPSSTALRAELPCRQRWRHALSSGDDYELCVTVPARDAQALSARLARLGTPFTRIGLIEAEPGLRLAAPTGNDFDTPPGYQHFN